MKLVQVPLVSLLTAVACGPALAQPILRCLTISSGAASTASGTILNIGQPLVSAGTVTSGGITLRLGSVTCLAGSCFANCDGSTATPVLNVNDFVCFNNLFASGSPSANCDGSTATPILNVNDFLCFNNRFAAGCP